MNNKKKVATGLIVAGIASINSASVVSLLKDEFLLEDSSKTIKETNYDYLNNISFESANSTSLVHDTEIKISNNVKDDSFEKALTDMFLQNKATSKSSDINAKLEILSSESLDLSGKGIKDLSGIENFINLKSLNISDNEISDISMLSKLPNLKEIIASNNKIYDISSINQLNIDKADFSNQNITLNPTTLSNNELNIKNPIITLNNNSKLDFNIPNKGELVQDTFKWNNINLSTDKIEIPFNLNNSKILFSGNLTQDLSVDKSLFENIPINISSEKSEWTNSNMVGKYDISPEYKELISSIELPNGETTHNLKGTFNIAENGIYNVKVNLTNNSTIEKELKVSNIDDIQPTINILSNHLDDSNDLKIEVIDNDSGLDYVLLPDGRKIKENIFTYSPKDKENIAFKVFDKAGNCEELKINSEYNEEHEDSPKIIADNKTIHLGDDFNPLSNIRAIDSNGKDISKDISILSNNLDTTSLGEYTVSYSVKDKNGYKSNKDVVVEVIDKPKNLNSIDYKSNPKSTKEVENSLKYQPTSTTKVKTKTTSSQPLVSSSDISNLNKNVYSSGILFAMVAGFGFLFKSGKDDF